MLECIKEELLSSLKDEILENIKANIKNLCRKETHFTYELRLIFKIRICPVMTKFIDLEI